MLDRNARGAVRAVASSRGAARCSRRSTAAGACGDASVADATSIPRAMPRAISTPRLRIARATRRRVLAEVGGEWCTWCHIMDRFFAANPDLRKIRDAQLRLAQGQLFEGEPRTRRSSRAGRRSPAIRTCSCSMPTAACCIRRTRARSRPAKDYDPVAVPRVSRSSGRRASRHRCRASAHATCSRTSADGSSARASSAATTAGVVGALPSPTARLRDQRS